MSYLHQCQLQLISLMQRIIITFFLLSNFFLWFKKLLKQIRKMACQKEEKNCIPDVDDDNV